MQDVTNNELKTTLTDVHGIDPERQDREIPVVVEANGTALYIRPEGYGEASAATGHGTPILLEVCEGRLRLVYWSDINEQDPTIVDLEAAREDNRKFYVGDKVRISHDSDEWGRIASDGTILSAEGNDYLVNVDSVRADIIIPKKDLKL